jgi:hypothetical protein
MNRDWMHERLEAFKKLCEDYEMHGRQTSDNTFMMRKLSDEMASQEPTVREILKRLDPKLAELVTEPDNLSGAFDSLRAVQKGLGILRDRDDWAANLAPDAPSLVADQFHPHVWAAASALWDTERYRVAVEQAAVSLSAHIASKVRSSLTERELVQQVFAPGEPVPKQVRLHMPGYKSSKTRKSRQEGLHLLAQGAFAGIRNVATHTEAEWPEQVALEHLAVLSLVGRQPPAAEPGPPRWPGGMATATATAMPKPTVTVTSPPPMNIRPPAARPWPPQ